MSDGAKLVVLFSFATFIFIAYILMLRNIIMMSSLYKDDK
jgi:hypothetical protein